MFYISALRLFKNCSFYHLVSKYPFKAIVSQPKKLYCVSRFPIDNISKLNKDVLLYTFERSKFYKYLTIFGIAQFTVWSFYAGMMYMSMKDVSNEELQKYEFFTKSPIWKHAFGGNQSFFYAIAFCIALGRCNRFVSIFVFDNSFRSN